MAPVPPLQLTPHVQPPGVQVDVGPREPEHLTATQPQRDREHERHSVGLVLGGGKDAPRLVDRERLELGRVVARGVGEADRVAREAPSSDGVVEGLVQGAAHVVDRPGVQALGEQHGVQVLDVLGLEAVQPVPADRRVDVPVHVDRVPGQGAGTHAHSRGGEPVGQPSLQARGVASG
ncbi:MAG TPA: hypothetical protein VFE45_14525 [Coriobacteriia bacterium]|nr:hypothetical protein [Coriobacteriia bacterium]